MKIAIELSLLKVVNDELVDHSGNLGYVFTTNLSQAERALSRKNIDGSWRQSSSWWVYLLRRYCQSVHQQPQQLNLISRTSTNCMYVGRSAVRNQRRQLQPGGIHELTLAQSCHRFMIIYDTKGTILVITGSLGLPADHNLLLF